MYIWSDPALLSRGTPDEYSSLCRTDESCQNDSDTSTDKGQTASNVPITSALTEEDAYYLHSHNFLHAQTLHIQPCQDAYWLICDPVEQGSVAVLDTEAYTLLLHFRTPRRLQDILETHSINPVQATKIVALFMHLGFLRDLDQPTVPFSQGQSQTLGAWLHVTNACNLSCHYCYVRKSTEHMAEDTSKRAVDAVMRSAVKQRYQHVRLTYAGGEATLRLPQVIATHDYALHQAQKHGLNLSAGMISNGAALPPRSIEQLRQRQIGIAISLDGIGEQHDQQRPFVNGQSSFAFVDRTITRLLAGGLVPSINVTVSRRNLDALPQLLEYILQRELPFGLSYYRENECSTHLSDLQFTDAHMINGMLAAFAYIEQHLPRRSLLGALVDKAKMSTASQHTCGVGRNYMVVDQRGGIAKCQADITSTVTTIDAENPLQAIREDRRGIQAVAVADKAGCRSCEWRMWCKGGCPQLTYQLTGRSDIQSPNCAIYKALFPAALRLEALRLLKYETPITI